MNAYCRAIRLERWPRSTAIFLGSAVFFFLHRDFLSALGVPGLFYRLLLSFFLTWAISTANYIVNEIADAPSDIHHPTKSSRPYVSGEIKRGPLVLLGLGLTFTGFFLAYLFFSRSFSLSLFLLLLAGFIYNIKPVRTKDIPFLDSISESANNPIRFLIGWFAFAPPDILPPVSILLCWWSFGNFLMVAKRLSEFRFLKDKASDYRISHKKYTKTALLFGMAVSTLIFFITYFLFAGSFKLQSFFLASPLLFFYFFLFYRKTLAEKEVMEEPEQLLLHPLYAFYTLLLLAIFLLAYFTDTLGQ